MAVHQFTDEQVNKARHALGLTRRKTAYRNYYTGPDDADWNDLVARGMATKREWNGGREFIYHLTKRAAFYFLNVGEGLDGEARFPVEPAHT